MNYEVSHMVKIKLSCRIEYKLCVKVTKLNKWYAHIVHKYYFVYEYVYNIIDYILNIRMIRITLNQELRKGDARDKGELVVYVNKIYEISKLNLFLVIVKPYMFMLKISISLRNRIDFLL